VSVFEYMQSGKAPLYRGIMRAFIDAKDEYLVHLRLQDVVKGVSDIVPLPEHEEIECALSQLCEWGNLETRPDTSSACTVDDFYNPRHTYHITSPGEAFEMALALYDANSEREHQLRCGGLADIRFVVQDIKQLSEQAERNAAQIHRNIVLLFTLFEDLTAAAQTLIRKLEARSDIQVPELRRLIESCRRFLGELDVESSAIGQLIQDVEHAGMDRLILVMVRRNFDERKEATSKTIANACGDCRLRWERFQNWFVGSPDREPGSTLLRGRLRSFLPALLRMSAGIHVEGTGGIDRSRDFRVLAKWFAQAASDAEAHVLWRAAFGLCPARHLTINDATIAEREAQDIPPNTSWMDAPPLHFSADEWRPAHRIDGLSRIIDRSSEKERLAMAIQQDAQRVLNAQHPFGDGNRVRLSEIELLATDEFELFLDVMGEAVSTRVSTGDIVEVLSSDGCLKVRLEPTGDNRIARISTTDGVFTGPDQWISVESIGAPDLPEVVA
jgi:uncharacterized protein (TIGR02677 family)